SNCNIIEASERDNINYNDNVALIINLINTFIDIITIALVCFTSLSLVVSTVMIGIITYVSVLERIKEIGVIRSLGGRKRDVSNLFNAETFIEGAISGLFGIGFTYLLCLIVNIIINNFASLGALIILPVSYAIVIIAISIGLTLVSGLIPARAAARKDPVVALRTE
ncbi:MAG: FtsX-like permease family protein, partial [Bacilli bacterium]|nr:FtsX-like permease family protein [Bacilli bacterium]